MKPTQEFQTLRCPYCNVDAEYRIRYEIRNTDEGTFKVRLTDVIGCEFCRESFPAPGPKTEKMNPDSKKSRGQNE